MSEVSRFDCGCDNRSSCPTVPADGRARQRTTHVGQDGTPFTETRRSGATAAAGDATATSLPVASHQDAPHPLCICDPELLALDVADLRCPEHGLAAALAPAIRAHLEANRG